MMRLELATAEYIGARAQQQDLAAALPLHGGAVLVLADGLGGHESGAEASRIVVETFKEAGGQGLFDIAGTRRQALRDTVERANQRIGDGVDPAHGHRGMASTVVAAVIVGGELNWVSVGDSHLYVWRGGRLAKLNEDHSQAGLMVRSGQYRPDDPEVQAVKSVLVSALTGRKLEIVDLPQRAFKVESGDVLVLASDGLNTLEDDEIGRIVADVHGDGAARLSTVLLETVRGRRVERQDNTTVAIARVLETPARPERETASTARTVTHQVSVPIEIDHEAMTERAPPEPSVAAAADVPAPASSMAAPAPADQAGEITGETGQRAGNDAQTAPSGEEPAGEQTAPESAVHVTAAAKTLLAKASRRGIDPAAIRAPTGTEHGMVGHGGLGSHAGAVGNAAVGPRRGAGWSLSARLLFWLMTALVALGAVATFKPDWLPDWLARSSSTRPAVAPAKVEAPGSSVRASAGLQGTVGEPQLAEPVQPARPNTRRRPAPAN